MVYNFKRFLKEKSQQFKNIRNIICVLKVFKKIWCQIKIIKKTKKKVNIMNFLLRIMNQKFNNSSQKNRQLNLREILKFN